MTTPGPPGNGTLRLGPTQISLRGMGHATRSLQPPGRIAPGAHARSLRPVLYSLPCAISLRLAVHVGGSPRSSGYRLSAPCGRRGLGSVTVRVSKLSRAHPLTWTIPTDLGGARLLATPHQVRTGVNAERKLWIVTTPPGRSG